MTHEGEPLLSLALEDENGREYKALCPIPGLSVLFRRPILRKFLRWEVAGQLRIEREYVREANSTYVIQHETVITNLEKRTVFMSA